MNIKNLLSKYAFVLLMLVEMNCQLAQAASLPGVVIAGDTVPADIKEVFALGAEVYPGYFVGASGWYKVADHGTEYTYQYYSGKGIYVGAANGKIFLLGGPFGNQIKEYGKITAVKMALEFLTSTGVCNPFDVWNVTQDGGMAVTGADGAVVTQPVSTSAMAVQMPSLENNGQEFQDILIQSLVAGANSLGMTGLKVTVKTWNFVVVTNTASHVKVQMQLLYKMDYDGQSGPTFLDGDYLITHDYTGKSQSVCL